MYRAAPWILLALCWLAAAAQQQMVDGWFIEDAAISFAYARNWVDGHGLVPFPGAERIEGYSNPLWVALLAFWEILGFGGFTSAKWMALFFTGWALYAAWRVARRTLPGDDEAWPLAAPAILATSSVFNMWAASGLENALFGALILTAIWRHLVELQEERAPWSPLLWLALALTRPEGLLYAAFAGGWWAIAALRSGRTGWDVLRWVLTFWIPGGLLLAARVVHFAWPLPMTYYGKIGSGGPQLLNWNSRGWTQIRTYATKVGEVWYLPLYLAALLGIRGRRLWLGLGAGLLLAAGITAFPRPGLVALGALVLPLAAIDTDRWEARTLLWTCCAIAVVFPAYANGDWMRGFRWMSLLAPPASVLLALGIRTVVEPLRARVNVRYQPALATSIPALFVLLLWAPPHYENSQWFASEGKNESPARIKRRVNYTNGIAKRLFLEEQVVNLDMDMGAFLWWSDQYLVDMAGLVDVPIAVHTWADRAFVQEYVLEERRPHFAHVHGHWERTTELTDYTDFEQNYLELPPWKDGAVRLHPGEWIRRDLLFHPAWTGAEGRRVEFANGVVLHGWETPDGPVGRGRAFALRAGIQVTERLVDGEFRLLAFAERSGELITWDLPLTDGLVAMEHWRPTDVYIGHFALEIPGEIEMGDYGLGMAILGPSGEIWPALEPHAEPRFAAGEVFWPEALKVVKYAAADRSADSTLDEALAAAEAGLCNHAEGLWRDAWTAIPKHEGWYDQHRPIIGAALASCWAVESQSADEVAALERARAWSPRSVRLARVAEPVADRLMEEGLAARAAGDWETAYLRFRDVLRVRRDRPWARRYAEEARNHRLGLGPLPMWGRSARAVKSEPPP